MSKKNEEQEGGGGNLIKKRSVESISESLNGNKFAILSQIEEGEDSGEVDKTVIDATVKTKRVKM